MKAVILAGGEGKRLRPLTAVVPKSLLPVNSKPILEIIIEQLQQEGFQDIYISAGYKSWMITSYFGDGSDFGVNIWYSYEKQPLGTAGPLRLIDLPEDEPVLAMNGDLLTEAPLRDIYAFHQDHQSALTVCSISHTIQVKYGVFKTESDHLLSVVEKPELNFEVFAGICVLSPSAIAQIPSGKAYQMTDLMERLYTNGERVMVYPVNGFWMDIGCREEYERSHNLLKSRSNLGDVMETYPETGTSDTKQSRQAA